MTNRSAPFPFDEMHAVQPEAASHIDALNAELARDTPDPKKIDEHVSTLRGHSGLASILESWYLDERTQTFIAELNGLGL